MPFSAPVPTKVNIALMGESGSGKTYTSLSLATSLFGRVAVVDTEHLASALYARHFAFDAQTLEAPFSPDRYATLIQEAESAGYRAVVLDSLSPEWDGPGGCLDLVEQATHAQRTPNTYTAWRDVTPMHESLLGTINRSRLAVFSTFRVKEKHEVTPDRKIRSLGLEPITRIRFEYEYDLVLRINANHQVTPVKSRFEELPLGHAVSTAEVLDVLRAYLSGGPLPATPEQKQEMWRLAKGRGLTLPALTHEVSDLTGTKYDDLQKLTREHAEMVLRSESQSVG